MKRVSLPAQIKTVTAAVLCTCILLSIVYAARSYISFKNVTISYDKQQGLDRKPPVKPTLIAYILSLADAAHIGNFLFFYYEAIVRDNSTNYDILVAQRHHREASLLPELPPHARYVFHGKKECRGLSLVRWHLRRSGAVRNGVERFVLLSSAVRGPFIPPGLRNLLTWHQALCWELGPRTALAGSVVSCVQPQSLPGQAPLPPFLEFTALGATRVAIEHLLALPASQLPECPDPDPDPGPDTVTHPGTEGGPAAEAAPRSHKQLSAGIPSLAVRIGGADPELREAAADPELREAAADPDPDLDTDPAAVLAADGLTAAEAEAMAALRAWSADLLAAGLGLSSLAVRQRGVDWSDRRSWGCNAGVSPLAEHANDGQSLTPFEAMFLPVGLYDNTDMPYGSPAEVAKTYSEWILAAELELASLNASSPSAKWSGSLQRGGEGGASPLLAHPPDGLPPRPDLTARNRYYHMGKTYRLPAVLLAMAMGEKCLDVEYFREANLDLAVLPPRDIWKFFVFVGQFQPRAFRLKCGLDWNKYELKAASGTRGGGRGGAASGTRGSAAVGTAGGGAP